MRRAAIGLGAVALGMVAAGVVRAQGATLERRIAAIGDGRAEFSTAARADACGDGRTWYRIGGDTWAARAGDGWTTDGSAIACAVGPLRLRVTVLAGEVLRAEAFVGPLQRDSTAIDLGRVAGPEVAEWLLRLARGATGRTAREAIAGVALLPAPVPGAELAAVARDEDRARDTRRAAVAALARLEGGEGIAALIALGAIGDDGWLAHEAIRALGRSSDPRARRELRAILADRRRPESARASAAVALGNDLASGDDARALRAALPGLEGLGARDSILAAAASVGGRETRAWLLTLARDEAQPLTVRRRATLLGERAGASGAELVALYDAAPDTETRGSMIGVLARDGSRAAREKLVAIAKSTEAPVTRRRAISALERFDGADVREALAGLARP